MFITQDVSEIASLMMNQRGAVIAYPTETFYGLGSRISDHDALERIIRIKGRDSSKGMIILVSDMAMASLIALIDERQQTLLKRFWPGPLSAVLWANENIDPLLAPGEKVAIRISPLIIAQSLIAQVGPITATSANVSGMMPAKSVKEIQSQTLDIDAILDGGETEGSNPSTIIDLTKWPPVCLRQGVIPFDKVISFSKNY